MIAVGGNSNKLYVFKYSRESRKLVSLGSIDFEVGAKIRSVRFNPLTPNIIAVGLFNGTIQLYDVEEDKHLKNVRCAFERIACIEWHPQYPTILAATSFDHNSYIVDTQADKPDALKFHNDRVRCCIWNRELPYLLTTAADDSRIAMWDIRSR